MARNNPSADAGYTQTHSALAMCCSVEIRIDAKPDVVWKLLTDAEGFPRWNSTVAGIEGRIREGERLRIRAPGTNRVFTPRVSGVVPAERMIWSDGVAGLFQGVRTFTLARPDDTSTHFAMSERFSGVMFALTKRMLPDFRPIFVAYAADLKREAQRLAGIA